MDEFRNINSETFWRWIIRKDDNLNQIVFFFISKINAQNARNFQLFDASKNVRIVYLKGLQIKYTDKISLKIFNLLIKYCKKKIMSYKIFHAFSIPSFESDQKQVLHIDDPSYSELELNRILNWEKNLVNKKGVPILVCTNSYSKNWFEAKLKLAKIHIIEQGFQATVLNDKQVNYEFSCVYSSPYIHLHNDKHGEHSTWGAEILIKEIIPRLNRTDPSIQIHLIGELGKEATLELSKYRNVFAHGRVDFSENANILSKCTLGIYPRTYDHKRSILKIFSYIGAGLPVVTFDLVDTKVIKDHELGLSVSNAEDFVLGIITLRENSHLLETYKNNIIKFRSNYSWTSLSNKMNQILNVTP